MNEIKGEVDHCRHRLMKYCQGQGLDLGCGPSKIKPDAIGVDLYHPEADMNMDARLLTQYSNEQFDYIFSSHLLEELQDTEGVLREWIRVLKKGGNLVLYQIVEEEYYPIGDSRCNSRHKHHYTWEELWAMAQRVGDMELVHHADPVGSEWSFELVIRKGAPTEISVKPTTSNETLKIMIVGGPADPYIDNCMDSLFKQDYGNWKAQIVLDPVGDDTYQKALKWVNHPDARSRIGVKLNETVQHAIPNLLKAAELLDPKDDDIMMTVDADDWLENSKVFSIIRRYFNTYPNLLITHGSWTSVPNPNCAKNNCSYTEYDFQYGLRHVQWKGSHLRTFKHKVWKYILDKDLRGVDGKYLEVAWDLAFMWPMLEMAGYNRIQFIPDILYVYNQITPFNDHKRRHEEQQHIENLLRHKEPYKYRESF